MTTAQIIKKIDNAKQLTAEEISALASAYLVAAEEARDWQTKTQDLSASLKESRAETEHFRSELFKLQNIRATHNRRKARAIARKLLAQSQVSA